MFPAAPAGVMFDTPQQVQAFAARIKERAVVNRTMPFVNKTGMSEEEREYGDPVPEVDTQGLGNPPAARVEDES